MGTVHMGEWDRFAMEPNGLLAVRSQTSAAAVRKLQRMCKAGRLRKLAPGVFIPVEKWEVMSPEQRLGLRALAVVPVGSSATITGAAALSLLGGWALYKGKRPRIIGGTRKFEKLREVVWHDARIDDCDVTERYGRRICTLAKAAFDEACAAMNCGDFFSAVVAVEGARHAGVSADELELVAARYPRTRGIKGFRKVLAESTGRADSVGEALTKGLLLRMGFRCGGCPPGSLPVFGGVVSMGGAVRGVGGAGAGDAGGAGGAGDAGGAGGAGDAGGAVDGASLVFYEQVDIFHTREDGCEIHVGRVDFFIPAFGLVIEFDGQIKYSAGAIYESLADVGEAIEAEHDRHRMLMQMGLAVVRLSWQQVYRGQAADILRRTIRECLVIMASRRPTFHGQAYVYRRR